MIGSASTLHLIVACVVWAAALWLALALAWQDAREADRREGRRRR